MVYEECERRRPGAMEFAIRGSRLVFNRLGILYTSLSIENTLSTADQHQKGDF